MNGSIADVCIVGVGAVGGILAKQLTSAGLKVVAFERGPALKTAEYAQRDSISYIARPDQLEGVRHEPRIFRTSPTQPGNLRYGTSPFNVLGGSNATLDRPGIALHAGRLQSLQQRSCQRTRRPRWSRS